MKKLDKWVPHELTGNLKKKTNHCFEASSYLILCNKKELFLDQNMMSGENWILYNNQG